MRPKSAANEHNELKHEHTRVAQTSETISETDDRVNHLTPWRRRNDAQSLWKRPRVRENAAQMIISQTSKFVGTRTWNGGTV